MMMWLIVTLAVVLGLGVAGFIIIARKGRELRKSQPLPPPSKTAYLSWIENGHTLKREVVPPFYFGRSEESNILLQDSTRPYEFCIFCHKGRFAIQTLEGGGMLLVNGQEIMAGYLWDGDKITIRTREFVFHCF